MDKMTKRCNTRREAESIKSGQRIWRGGHETVEHLVVAESVKVSRDAEGQWYADIAVRPATQREFCETRVAWLENEVRRTRQLAPDNQMRESSMDTLELSNRANYETAKRLLAEAKIALGEAA